MTKRNTEVSTAEESTDTSSCPQIELLRGHDGQNGRDGRDGLPGTPGSAGRDGKDGEKGEKGCTGPVGPPGDTGSPGDSSQGDQGPQGPQGAKGDTGPPGEKGSIGDPGLPEPSIIKGAKGMKGEAGNSVVGPPGTSGPPGRDGSKGEKGASGVQGPQGLAGGGVVYTRWGRTTCPSGRDLVYEGVAAGGRYNEGGGGVGYLCLPEDPNYLSYDPGYEKHGKLYGGEYVEHQQGPLASVNYHDVPCAVCYAARKSTVLMIPAKTGCPSSWTQEYYGYLMSEASTNSMHTNFVCVDKNPESIPGSSSVAAGVSFFHVEATCIGIPCPPYVGGREVTCTVCTK